MAYPTMIFCNYRVGYRGQRLEGLLSIIFPSKRRTNTGALPAVFPVILQLFVVNVAESEM
jgi:hypothetical protein